MNPLERSLLAEAELQDDYEEEACRDFLVHEIGVEIPRFYRYAEGIEEVRRRILLRYGDVGYAKALGIFIELLEREDNASGLGDDGDLWRSWRHDYRRRGENLANPGTPRFSNLILPAAVSPRRKYSVATPTYDEELEKVTPQRSYDDSKRAMTPLRASQILQQRDHKKQLPPPNPPHVLPNRTQQLTSWHEGSATSTTRSTMEMAVSPRKSLRETVANNITGLFGKEKEKRKEQGQHVMLAKEGQLISTNNRRGRQNSPFIASLCFDGACDSPNEERRTAIEKAGKNGTERAGIPIDDYSDHLRIPLTGSTTTQDDFHVHRSAITRIQGSINSAEKLSIPSLTAVPPSISSKTHRIFTRNSPLNPSVESKKDRFRSPNRSPRNMESSPSSHGILGNFSPLDPTKYSPPMTEANSPEISHPYARYESVAWSNPFEDEENHRLRVGEAQRDEPMHYGPQSPRRSKGIPQSYTTGSIAFRAHQDPFTAACTHSVGEEHQRRGRSTSPVKAQFRFYEDMTDKEKIRFLEGVKEDIEEDLPQDLPRPLAKRSRSPMKKMFGENGWLGKSPSMYEIANEYPRKSNLKQWSGKIRQRVGGITEDMNALSRLTIESPFNLPRHSHSHQTPSKFPVSLDPPAQSTLSSKIELMLITTANAYILRQHAAGRLSPDTVVKVMDYWKSRGRPQVIEFQFDQASQRDLIVSNLKTFTFHGKFRGDRLAINSMLYMWRTIAKEMSIRTFCTPDSVLRKHMHDTYRILELLGAATSTFIAFNQTQVRALKDMKEQQLRRADMESREIGVEKPWYPPSSQVSEHDERARLGYLDEVLEEKAITGAGDDLIWAD